MDRNCAQLTRRWSLDRTQVWRTAGNFKCEAAEKAGFTAIIAVQAFRADCSELIGDKERRATPGYGKVGADPCRHLTLQGRAESRLADEERRHDGLTLDSAHSPRNADSGRQRPF